MRGANRNELFESLIRQYTYAFVQRPRRLLRLNLLTKKQGDKAPIHAAIRADELLDAGDLDGAAARRSIIRAIEELQKREPV